MGTPELGPAEWQPFHQLDWSAMAAVMRRLRVRVWGKGTGVVVPAGRGLDPGS